MAAWTTISNALVAVGAKPFATTIQALRDNTVALAEADPSVPAELLPTVLLGSASPSGASSSTISSLVLTPFKLILVSYSFSTQLGGGTGTLALGSGNLATGIPSVSSSASGMAIIDLVTGRFGNMYGGGGTNQGSNTTGYSSATTSMAISFSGTSPQITGSWRIYGMK